MPEVPPVHDPNAQHATMQPEHTRTPPMVRLTPFTPENPALWLNINEQLLELSGVVRSAHKFTLVCAALPSNIQLELAQCITQALQQDDPYAVIKRELLDRYTIPQSLRLQALMSEELGGRNPNQLLAHLRAQQGSELDPNNGFLKTIFLRALPPQVRAILAAHDNEDLSVIAQAATRIMESCQPTATAQVNQLVATPAPIPALEPTVATAQTQLAKSASSAGVDNHSLSGLTGLIAAMQMREVTKPRSEPTTTAELTVEIGALATKMRRLEDSMTQAIEGISRQLKQLQESLPREPRRWQDGAVAQERGRTRNRSQGPPGTVFCRYHQQYGMAARTCQPGCQWPYAQQQSVQGYGTVPAQQQQQAYQQQQQQQTYQQQPQQSHRSIQAHAPVAAIQNSTQPQLNI